MGKIKEKIVKVHFLVCCTLIVIQRLVKKKKEIWTRLWLQKRNVGRGVLPMIFDEIRLEDPNSYRNYLRMDEECFSYLLNIIRPSIEKMNTNMRECIPAEMRLAVCLRYLATGNTLKDLSFSTRIAHNTLSIIINEVMTAICNQLRKDYLKVPRSQEDWKYISDEIAQRWNFPHCVGAIDGKHITFRPLKVDGAFYRNYKGTNSIVSMALVDSNYKFRVVDIGMNGRISDGGIFSRSPLGQEILNGQLNYFPPPEALPGRTKMIPYVIVADDAFPLKNNIMKPYQHRGLTKEKRIYNYRLSRARRVVENAFGILANRFQILLKTMNVNVEKVELITKTCVILHNFLCQENSAYTSNLEEIESSYPEPATRRYLGNRTPNEAHETRMEFTEYFNGNGAVPWQEKMVEL